MAARVSALLDTSVLIGADSGDGLPASAAISAVTLGELRAGVLLAKGDDLRQVREARLSAVRAAFAPLPVDADVALRYGEILALARMQRRTARASDLLILATAAAHGRTLTTRDERQARLGEAADVPVALLR